MQLSRFLPGRRTVARDVLAGLPGAVASVPDGMASAVLAGVSPIHGLYASFAGPAAGGALAGTRLMVITTTTAAALAAGSAVAGVSAAHRADALVLLTLLAGAVMAAAAALRLGRYTRFVSLSVMIGFLTGVAANIVFGQIPDLTGAAAQGPFALAKAWDVAVHPGRIDVPSLLAGLAAVAIIVLVGRTRLGVFSTVIGLVVPTLATLGVEGIARVSDAGAIPRGIPLPALPHLRDLSPSVVTGALAVAVIVLVQGAGVAESAPNAGGRADADRDFLAQGAGNIASGLFRGQPVGGSVGQTAINVRAGAQTRWAAIFSGLWMLAILAAFAGIVGRVAMPTLAAVLIVAAVASIRTGELMTIYRTGLPSRIALVTTFLATLFLPIAAAVGIGVALSLLLQLNAEAIDLAVVEMRPLGDGRFVERPAPPRLESRSVVLLDVYGSLYYAGARTLEARLPDPGDAEAPVVVLRLRGRTALGATAFTVLARYADRLEAAGGSLFLSGVDAELLEQFQRAGGVEDGRHIRLFPATELIGESTLSAYDAARRATEQERT